MAGRDELTYDLPNERDRRLPWKAVALLAVTVLTAIVLVAAMLLSDRAATTAPSPVSASSVSATPPAVQVTASPVPSGSDAGETTAVPDGSQQAAAVFVRAWLDPDPKSRKPALERVAAPALAEQLMLTDPANVPRATPLGAPVMAEASSYSAVFTQTLTTGLKIQVYLVSDPSARYRWLTTSVQPA
jgi:hypothetical protein